MGEVFDRYTDTVGNYHFTDTETGHHVIPRLDNNSTKVDNKNDELVRRRYAIDALEERLKANGYSNITLVSELNRSIGYLIRLPSAQRKGKWIATQEWGGRNYSCSCCKFSFMVDTCMYDPLWNFCPNCGARIEKGEEDETD